MKKYPEVKRIEVKLVRNHTSEIRVISNTYDLFLSLKESRNFKENSELTNYLITVLKNGNLAYSNSVGRDLFEEVYEYFGYNYKCITIQNKGEKLSVFIEAWSPFIRKNDVLECSENSMSNTCTAFINYAKSNDLPLNSTTASEFYNDFIESISDTTRIQEAIFEDSIDVDVILNLNDTRYYFIFISFKKNRCIIDYVPTGI